MARVPSLPFRVITTCQPVGQQQPRIAAVIIVELFSLGTLLGIIFGG